MHVGDVDAGHQLLQILNPVDPLRLQRLAATTLIGVGTSCELSSRRR
jgi:hypothetical protein